MKVLFLCHRFPYPPDHGAKIRAYHFIRHLSRKHNVTVATLAYREEEIAAGRRLEEECQEVMVEIVPSRARWRRAGAALFSGTPSSVAYFHSPELKRRVLQKLRTEDFDVVIVFCAFMAQYVLDWKSGYRVLDYCDLDSAKWADYSRWRRFPLSLGYAIEAAKLRRYERRIARHFHCCTVTTRGELQEYEKLGVATPGCVVPNGVDAAYFAGHGASADPGTIAFVGRMDYYPNIDGINYFAKEIFPLVRNRRPEAKLRIIGSDPVRSVRELARLPNVSVTGEVPDVRPYVKDAAVSIVPLRIARGTQNKILESMALGVPVVATPEAAKGVEAIPGRDLLVADGPQAFAAEVIGVMEDGALRNNLARAGRQQVEEAHSWERSMAILDDILVQAHKRYDVPEALTG